MSEQRQRSERHVQINPYYRRTGAWEPFQDWPTSRMFDQVSERGFKIAMFVFKKDDFKNRKQ